MPHSVQKLIDGGLVTTPVWLAAVKRFPPINAPKTGRVATIVTADDQTRR